MSTSLDDKKNIIAITQPRRNLARNLQLRDWRTMKNAYIYQNKENIINKHYIIW